MYRRGQDSDAARIAAFLEMPLVEIAAAVRYAEVYAAEINAALADNQRAADNLPNLIPHLKIVAVDASPT